MRDDALIVIVFYYIQSHEIQENIDEIYCIFYIFTSENIFFYIFTPPQCTSELQTPITFLFVNKNIKCGYAFS